jgi:hypothetical protein
MAHVMQPNSLVWRKASASEAGSCVEVARHKQTIFVRDSKNSQGPVVQTTEHQWRDFLQAIKMGAYDLSRF